MGLAITSFTRKLFSPAAARPVRRETSRRWARPTGRADLLRLEVAEVIEETPSTRTFVFGNDDLAYAPGQHVTLVVGVGGQTVRRCYSFSSAPVGATSSVPAGAAVRPAITVKRVEGGVLSNWLHDHVRAGDELRALPAAGRFTIEPDSSLSRHCAMVAGGVGITPLVSMTEALLRGEARSRVTLFYGSRSRDEIIFHDRLRALAAQFGGRLELVLAVEDAPGDWQGLTGRLDGERVVAAIGDRAVDEWFVCGPQPMMDSVVASLSSAGVAQHRIHVERFQYAETRGLDRPTSPATLVFHASGVKATARPGTTILEAAEQAGVTLPSSCRMGGCGACKVKVDGTVVTAEPNCLTEQEKADGYALACCSYGDGRVVVRDF